jgi:hypothetical protein
VATSKKAGVEFPESKSCGKSDRVVFLYCSVRRFAGFARSFDKRSRRETEIFQHLLRERKTKKICVEMTVSKNLPDAQKYLASTPQTQGYGIFPNECAVALLII